MKEKIKKINVHIKISLVIVLITSFFNILAILSNDFADIYRKYIFNKINIHFSRISNIFPFSLGEIMIVLGILSLILFLIALISFVFRSNRIKTIRKHYLIFFMYILVFVYVSETFNCFIMYRTSYLKDDIKEMHKTGKLTNNEILDYMVENNYITENDREDFSSDSISDYDKLVIVNNYIIDRLNHLSEELPRYENGDLICDVSYDDYKRTMQSLGNDLTLLKGYYPDAKKIFFSNIMTQQWVTGVYFPFSMESNYNRLMYCSNFPAVICHEYSHLKGYIREDEANFIAFLACSNSDNKFIEYSGLLSVYNYLYDDWFLSPYASAEEVDKMQKINDFVYYDDMFLKEEDYEEVEEDAIISTEIIENVNDTFIDTNLKINGVSSGIENYSEVVELILIYYFG